MPTGALVIAAEHFAREAHRDQKRKFYDAPYIVHPARCAQKASQRGFPPHAVAAMWCHDVIEDCGTTFDRLEDATDQSVASLVWCMTNPSKRHPNWPRAAKKQIDREHIGRQSTLVRQLKLIDRIDNLQDMVKHAFVTPAAMMRRYAAETRELMEVLAERLVTRISVPIMHWGNPERDRDRSGLRSAITAVDGTDAWLEREAWRAIREVETTAEYLENPRKLSDNPPGNSDEIPQSTLGN